ncbi:regulator of G-protein signaling 9-like [Syngnathoides biaculeatus]|uniref:regulator of G-protein signaling 9-like n=1 Tax=Syngnathoides biaculeatus TaxID=300417 RepID=UPI002ADE952B|nr:regulator of G-protein signaling 9-like [Syngnathoides biaculeatus]
MLLIWLVPSHLNGNSCHLFKLPAFLIPQLCRFTTPVPHLAVYSGLTDSPFPNPSSSLANLAPCPSPVSVAPDSTSGSERRAETGGEGERGGGEAVQAPGQTCKSRVVLSLRRLLRRGCGVGGGPSAVFASLSPKCHAAAGAGGRIQPISPDASSQAPPRKTGNFFQIKVDIPPECRIYPIESEDEEEDNRGAAHGSLGAKEIICPWESLTAHNGTG